MCLTQPLEDEKCADACHCLCGLPLNLTRKYSLPVFAYQTAFREPMSLGRAADRLHYETHINQLEFNEGYIEKVAILVIVSCAAAGCVLGYETFLGLSLNPLTLCIAVLMALWIANSFASSWVMAKESREVRLICDKNRTTG
jgi:hypothetical protein